MYGNVPLVKEDEQICGEYLDVIDKKMPKKRVPYSDVMRWSN